MVKGANRTEQNKEACPMHAFLSAEPRQPGSRLLPFPRPTSDRLVVPVTANNQPTSSQVRGYCTDGSNPEVFDRVNVRGDIRFSDIHHNWFGL